MIRWLITCFRGPHKSAQVPGGSIVSSPDSNAEQASTTAGHVLYAAGTTRPDALLSSTLDMDRFVETEQADVPAVTSLEEARQVILRLKTRVRELEVSAGQNTECTLMSLRQIRLPEQESKTGTTQVSIKRSNEPMPSVVDTSRDLDVRDEHKSVPHLFCAYTKQELMELMGRAGKPAAAVLLQAVCEEDVGNVPPALLLDVDPAVGDSVAGEPELVAALKNGLSATAFSQFASVERLPSYLRLRLYMMQACGARPRLACATATARALFKARTDRQLQYVLEGQVQQDAMLGMLLQEMLDEMLSAPVNRSSAATAMNGDCSTIVLHSLNHFVNTSNPKVFPFVPVSMRGCGYKKTSGEVVPCIVFEFSPDSNQGAFLEHLQRDYTMMGHISAIITLFTLKGDVLHQNAGSIAYYGYQRRHAPAIRTEKRTGFAHRKRNDRRISSGLPPELDGSAAAWLQRDERSALMKLFQYAPPDALESMLESMVQGGVWRSILPVPASLASCNRPLAAPGGLCDPLAGTLGMSPAAAFMGPDADSVFTMDGLAFTGVNAMSFAQPYDEPFVSNRPDAFEGSFALGASGGSSAAKGTYGGCASGHLHAKSMRALKAVPEQSQEHERVSFAQQRPKSPAENDPSGQVRSSFDLGVATSVSVGPFGVGKSSTSNRKLSPRYIRSTSVTIDEEPTKPIKVPRRSTTFSVVTSGGIDHQAQVLSGNGGAGSFTSGAVARNSSPRMSRIRRRSGLPIALDGGAAGALSQSTWGLFSNSLYENRHDKSAGRGAGGADGEHASDTRTSPGRHFTAASTVPFGAVSTAVVAASHGATGPASGASETAMAGIASASAGPFSARRSEITSPSLISPSLSSQVDQWQQWQYRHSQWQDALQSQSQPSQAFHLGHTAPGRMSNHPTTAAWILHQHQTGFSQSSSSIANQSCAHSSGPRGVAGMAGAMDGTGGDTGGGTHRQSSVESMARQQRSVALGDSMTSPTSRSTPMPSAGSLVSPQPSAHQHTDSNIMGCTTFVATAGNAPLDPSHMRSSALLPPSQLSRFSPSSPAGSPLLGLASPPGGAGGSPSAAVMLSALKSQSGTAPPHRTSSANFELAPAQQGLQKLFPVSASAPSAAASVYARGADAVGATGALSGNVFAQQIHSASAGSGSMRRAPMRQSERSNPNLVLPRAGSASTTTNAVKSATSFSFGCKGPGSGAHHPRPLIRMMSFLNATSNPNVQQPLQLQHGYNSNITGQGSATQQRQITRRAASGQCINMLDPVMRTGSGKMTAAADSSIGAMGPGGISSHSGSRHPPSTFLCGSVGLRRQSVRAPSAAALIHQVSSVDESSSMAVLTTMATLGNSREAAGEPRGGVNCHTSSAPEDGLAQTYHEVTATPFLDPVSKAQVVMVVQTDVTARVQLERRLADVMEAEHKLLENIFPRHVLEHIAHSAAVNQERASQFNLRMLSEMPDLTKTATDHQQVTILFADIVGFTSMCKEVPAKTVMKFLNDLYTRFDSLLDIYGVYKVETIGDCYMVAGGLISKDADGFAAVRKDSCDNLQAWRVLSFAKAMLRDAQKVLLPTTQEPVKLRVGIHTGPVVSGVVGTRMPRFCLFGDTINTASRMESTCPYGRIQVSAATYAFMQDEDWEPTGGVQVKGKGIMETYLLKQAPVVALPTNLAAASMSTPGLPDPAPVLTHGSSNISRLAPRPLANGSGVNSAAQGSGASVSASVAHGVISAVTEKIPVPNVTPTLAPASTQNGTGGAPGDASRLGGSSSGKNPSFLFNTVW